MDGEEFLRRIRRLAKARALGVRWEPRRGKGSHGRLYVGDRFTTVKDRKKEIGPGLLRKMCRDLNLDPEEL